MAERRWDGGLHKEDPLLGDTATETVDQVLFPGTRSVKHVLMTATHLL